MTAGRSDLLTISERELVALMKAFPGLQRMDILHAIVKAGPWRHRIERELMRVHLQRIEKAQLASRSIRLALDSNSR